MGVVAGEGALVGVLFVDECDALVVEKFAERGGVDFVGASEFFECFGADFDFGVARVEFFGCGGDVFFVVDGCESDGVGSEPEVGVAGDEYDRKLFAVAEHECGCENERVGGFAECGEWHLGVDADVGQYAECAAVVEGDALGEVPFFAASVNDAGGFAGVASECVLVAFELVELFEHGDGYDDVVVAEPEDGVWVGEEDVGVEYEVFNQG